MKNGFLKQSKTNYMISDARLNRYI